MRTLFVEYQDIQDAAQSRLLDRNYTPSEQCPIVRAYRRQFAGFASWGEIVDLAANSEEYGNLIRYACDFDARREVKPISFSLQ